MAEPVAGGGTDGRDIVVIIDDAEERRKKMVGAFAELGHVRVQIAYQRGSQTYFVEDGVTVSDLGPALLTLRHFRNQDVAPDLETSLTIYFGGSGGDDPEAPPNAPYRIWRHVGAEGGNLSPAEAVELLKYVRGLKDRTDPSVPHILKDPRTVFLLPSLSVLCQGYLAAHAVKESAGWGPPIIRPALRDMGLLDFFERGGEDAKLMEDVLSRQRDSVASHDWWLIALGKNKKAVEDQAVVELGLRTLYENSPIKVLIDAVYEGAASGAGKIQPEVVANAYCAIAERLTDRQCDQG